MPGKHTLSDPATAVPIREILSPERITLKLTVSGKEDLFGQLSVLLSRDVAGLDRRIAQNSLIERERLGSAGIGQGIALPHGRLPGWLGASAPLPPSRTAWSTAPSTANLLQWRSPCWSRTTRQKNIC